MWNCGGWTEVESRRSWCESTCWQLDSWDERDGISLTRQTPRTPLIPGDDITQIQLYLPYLAHPSFRAFIHSFIHPSPEMQCDMSPNQPMADRAMEASILPPPPPPPPSHLPPHAPPLALLKPSQTQTVPEVNRPDSAYGSSGRTPSLLSTVCKAAYTTG